MIGVVILLMKILVLGATGKLGCYSAIHLAKLGHFVIASGRRDSDNGFFADHKIDYIGGLTLENPNSFSKLPLYVDAVVHMAGTMPAHVGTNPMPYVKSIVEGMVNLLEWMRKGDCRRIVFNTTPSDVSAFFGEDVQVPEDAPRSFPKDGGDHAVYAICKNAAVDILEHYRIAYGFMPIIFRHLSVYAWHPNSSYYVNGVKKILPWRRIMRMCMDGEPIEVWGNPLRKKELLYVDDFTEAVGLAVKSNICGLFNLPGVRPYTLDEQIQGLIDAFSPNPKSHQKIYLPDKPSTPQNLLALGMANTELGWKARIEWNEACRRMRIAMGKKEFEKLWGKPIGIDF